MKKLLLFTFIFCCCFVELSATNLDWSALPSRDEFPMEIVCPANEIISCAEYTNYTPPPIVTDGTDCEGTEYEAEAEVVVGTCDSTYAYYVSYTYTPVHGVCFGGETCTMVVFVEKETIADVDMPINYDGLPGNEDPLSCLGGFAVDIYGNPSPDVTGVPGGLPGGCAQITSTYSDQVHAICGGCYSDFSSYEVIRTWTIIEWCTNTILTYNQIIKVMDTEPPVVNSLNDITVSVDAWNCGATIDLPFVSAVDNCTSDGSISYSFSSSAGVQVGNSIVLDDPAQTMQGAPVIITVTASDCCGNSSFEEFAVTVVDLVPPVNNAESSRVVNLSTGGIGHAFAMDFDDGSYDNCGQIGFLAKRMDNGGSCAGDDLFGNGLVMGPNGVDDNAEFNEIVHFCCADVGEPVMVIFRVCDDGDADGFIGTAGDNCNSSMVEVIVQDKLAPEITCPPNMTISCVDLAGLGDLQELDDDFLNAQFGYANGAATCLINVTQTISGSDACGEGTIFRNFTATNSIGESVTCTQFITVSAGPENILSCDRISFSNLNNNIYNWCAVNDNNNDNDDDLPALVIDCVDEAIVPELDINIDGFCTDVGLNIEIDTFNFADGACRKFLIHYEAIDNCIFDDNYVNDEGEIDPYNSNNGYFEFYIEIDAFDSEAPTLDCEDITVTIDDCEGYNGLFSMSGTDNCTDPLYFSYQYRFDVGADDVDISDYIQGSTVWPGNLGLLDFPVGSHIIYWLVSDGCGNDATCSQLVTIENEDIPPTPYCYDGLTTVVMPDNGMVGLWANDFDAGSFDNCDSTLILTMVPEQDIEGLTEIEAYNLSFTGTQQPNGDYGWTFDCSYIPEGLSSNIEVRIYVTDMNGNWDFCTASLRLDDNFNSCGNFAPSEYNVYGDIKTEFGEGISEVELSIDAEYPEFPLIDMVDDEYSKNLIEYLDYQIVPTKNDNHLNGITTLDIVLIQKHILGLSVIESPYTLIAADVDNNCEVDGMDIIQLRKLLLGKYDTYELPNNTSWRFIDDSYSFVDPKNPCNFREDAEIINLQDSVKNDFVGVKIGDVNATAEMNLVMDADARTDDALTFVVDDEQMEKGERRISFRAKDFDEIYGFQYELTWEDANFVSIESGELELSEGNFSNDANSLLVSKDFPTGKTIDEDVVLFTLVLDVRNDMMNSEILHMSSTDLLAEAYIGEDLAIIGTNIEYRSLGVETIDQSFGLLQNNPNPFNESTTISFVLPEAGKVILSVYDITGKVLYSMNNVYPKGINKVTIEAEMISATGLVYYQIESGGMKSTKRMIILD